MILGGTVRYEDGVKTTAGDTFSPTRKVAVELNFAIPGDPGIDAGSYVNDVLDKAIALTNAKLGLKAATAKAVVVKVGPSMIVEASQADVDSAKALDAAVKAKMREVKRGPKHPPEKDEIPLGGAEKPSATVGDEIPLDGAPTQSASASPVAPTSAGADAASMDEFSVEPVKEVTDKDLNDAVQKKNQAIKSPPKIKEVLAAFNPDPKKPFTLREIPQTQRQTFLTRLEALTA